MSFEKRVSSHFPTATIISIQPLTNCATIYLVAAALLASLKRTATQPGQFTNLALPDK